VNITEFKKCILFLGTHSSDC